MAIDWNLLRNHHIFRGMDMSKALRQSYTRASTPFWIEWWTEVAEEIRVEGTAAGIDVSEIVAAYIAKAVETAFTEGG
jgi:hypothetical protein